MSQIARSRRNKPVNERVRILCIIHYRGAADVLDNQYIALVVRMNTLETAPAETPVQRAQTSACSGVRVKIGAHFDDTAVHARLLRKEHGSSKRIPG